MAKKTKTSLEEELEKIIDLSDDELEEGTATQKSTAGRDKANADDKHSKGGQGDGPDSKADKAKNLNPVNEEDDDDEDEDEKKDKKETFSSRNKSEGFDKKDDDEEDEDDDEDDDKDKSKGKKKNPFDSKENRKEDADMEEHLDALFEGETLPKEFKKKASIIFETAIKSKLNEEYDRIDLEVEDYIDERLTESYDEVVESVDKYLDHVVTDWMTQNELAIETGVRSEIAESFMTKLKALFEDHYIDVPEDKVDLVDELANEKETLEADLDESTKREITLKEELVQYKKEAVFTSVCEDLTETEKEKLKDLSEDTDFEDEDSYTEKLETIKSSYFKKGKITESKNGKETAGTNNTLDENGNSKYEKYAKYISDSSPKI